MHLSIDTWGDERAVLLLWICYTNLVELRVRAERRMWVFISVIRFIHSG